MAKPKKLNSMRVLERAKVSYEVLVFPDTLHSAEGVADYLGIPRYLVYKTLVVERLGRGKPLLVIVPGDRELDLKKLAVSVGEKKLRMASHSDAERLTKLKVGGISPLALLNRGFDIYLDRPAVEQERIVISAGRRGVNLRVGVTDLIEITGCGVVSST